MSNTHLNLLLQLIHASGEINSLLQRGLHFSQIAELISFAEENGLILEKEDRLELTEQGLETMRMASDSKKIRGDGGWISPMDEYRIERMDIDEVYLPKVKTVTNRLRRRH